MRQGRIDGQPEQRSVRLPAVVLTPRHFPDAAVQIPPADAVVLADLGSAQPRENAFGLVSAGAFVLERYRVVDALGVKPPYSSFNV